MLRLWGMLWIQFAVVSMTLRRVTADNPYDWSPSISVSDNLDEPDGSGFCIDIAGFGSNLNCNSLQAHSCKSQGSDTQFEYDAAAKTIRSVNYGSDCSSISNTQQQGGCVAANALDDGSDLRISQCGSNAQFETFEFNFSTGQLTIQGATALLCLAVSDDLSQAGPFWARDLYLADCDSISDSKYISWTIVPIPEEPGVDRSSAPSRTTTLSTMPSKTPSTVPDTNTPNPTATLHTSSEPSTNYYPSMAPTAVPTSSSGDHSCHHLKMIWNCILLTSFLTLAWVLGL